jgi:hypothetical protein
VQPGTVSFYDNANQPAGAEAGGAAAVLAQDPTLQQLLLSLPPEKQAQVHSLLQTLPADQVPNVRSLLQQLSAQQAADPAASAGYGYQQAAAQQQGQYAGYAAQQQQQQHQQQQQQQQQQQAFAHQQQRSNAYQQQHSPGSQAGYYQGQAVAPEPAPAQAAQHWGASAPAPASAAGQPWQVVARKLLEGLARLPAAAPFLQAQPSYYVRRLGVPFRQDFHLVQLNVRGCTLWLDAQTHQ